MHCSSRKEVFCFFLFFQEIKKEKIFLFSPWGTTVSNRIKSNKKNLFYYLLLSPLVNGIYVSISKHMDMLWLDWMSLFWFPMINSKWDTFLLFSFLEIVYVHSVRVVPRAWKHLMYSLALDLYTHISVEPFLFSHSKLITDCWFFPS